MALHNRDILAQIQELPAPKIVEVKDYNQLLQENIDRLKEYLPNYKPLESDRYMKDLRVLTYKQYQGQIHDNYIIKQLLITTATGEALDHLTAFLDVWRLKGSKPYANYRFELSDILDYDVTIPSLTELTDNDGVYRAYVLEDTTIKAGQKSAVVKVELDAFIETTKLKTEIITTPLPFVTEAKAIEDYAHGADAESDDALRVRAIRALGKFSTAGSVDSYLYWIYSADKRITDAVVYGKKGTLEVNIYLHAKEGVDGVMIDRVEANLSDEKVRPLGDDVRVYSAGVKEVTINAEIELFDIGTQSEADATIKANFERESFVIGQHLTRTEVIKNLQVNGVYKVNTTFRDAITDKTEIIKIKALNLSYKEATYE